MTELVDAGAIEQIVGARRHASFHLGRFNTTTGDVHILHSRACLAVTKDLRECEFSLALDGGIDVDRWWPPVKRDRPVMLSTSAHGDLIPFALPSDVKEVKR